MPAALIKKEGEGVHADYHKSAFSHCDILFRVKIKGRENLTKDIPLHMSLKIFENAKEIDLEKIKRLVKEFNIEKPDTKGLRMKAIIFAAEKTGIEYYMLVFENIDSKYEKFYNELKNVGTVYKRFFPHVTLDWPLYDQIKREGLNSDEVEFGEFVIEEGPRNTIYSFDQNLEKSESLEKGKIKNTLASIGAVGAMAGAAAPHNTADATIKPPEAKISAQAPAKSPYDRKRMLNTISSVESQHGKLENHKPLGGMHHGESAFGQYGLTPVVIRETVKLNPDLKQKYRKLASLQGDDLHRYMQDNPGLENVIADRHLQRLEHHFGQDPSAIGYAWLEGINGTYKAKKENKDIKNHWHVKKINDAYGRSK